MIMVGDRRLSRRGAFRLGLTGLGLAAGLGGPTLLAGCTNGTGADPGPDPYCVSRGSLSSHGSLRGAPLIYDISEEHLHFWFDDGFYAQLGRWLDDYLDLSGTERPDQVWTYGSWLDGKPGCRSWHDAGRAVDLSRLVRGGRVQVSARYDIWQHYTGARLDHFRTRYWSLAASLHRHFAYVLTYLYNPTHHNHLHVDNGRSGSKLSSFDSDSTSQVQAVQGMLNHIWGHRVDITGRYDRPTRKAADAVLEQAGIDGSLDDGDHQWHGFLRATTVRPWS